MKIIAIINLVFCILLSSNFRNQGDNSNQDNQTTKKTVFLGFVLGSSHKETLEHINLLINKGKIKKSNSFRTLGLKENDVYEYPFFVKYKDYPSIFSFWIDSMDELNSFRIEIQDSEKTIKVEDVCALLKKKYGNPTDSTLSYQMSTYPDEYKSYDWKLDGFRINLGRKYLSEFLKKSNNGIELNEKGNFFIITYTTYDLQRENLPYVPRHLRYNQRIIEGQKRIENDL